MSSSSSTSSSSSSTSRLFVEVTKKVTPGQTGFRLQMWISKHSPEIPEELFVYQKISPPPGNDYPEDMWAHIASYADIAAYPLHAPDDYTPFFRKNGLDLAFKTRAALEDTWSISKAHLRFTVEDISRILGLPPAEVIEVIL